MWTLGRQVDMTKIKETEYKGFLIEEVRPSSRTTYRIYKNGKFYHASKTLKKAKSMIDFCIENGVWS